MERLQVNEHTFLREGDRRSAVDVDYVVEDTAGRWCGNLQIRQGRLTGSCGIAPEEYLQVQRVLPRVDFSLWGRGVPAPDLRVETPTAVAGCNRFDLEVLTALVERECRKMEADGEIIGIPDGQGETRWYLPHQLQRGQA
jgi:hypothetical protein